MRDPKASRAIRAAAGVMGIMILVVVLFSALYIAAEADHGCGGEGCAICSFIRQCENNLRQFGSGTAAQLAVIAPILIVLLTAVFFVTAIFQDTPVSRKVRLNN